MGSCLTICQTCLPCSHLVDGCGCSPGLSSGNKKNCQIRNSAVTGSMVVMTSNSRSRCSVSIPSGKRQVYSHFLPRNWCVETMGEGDHEVMCRARQLSLPEWGELRVWKGVAGVCWWTVGDGWWFCANAPVWESVGGGFTGKGVSEVWVDCSCWLTWVAAWLFVKRVCPVHLVDESVIVFHAPVWLG